MKSFFVKPKLMYCDEIINLKVFIDDSFKFCAKKVNYVCLEEKNKMLETCLENWADRRFGSWGVSSGRQAVAFVNNCLPGHKFVLYRRNF